MGTWRVEGRWEPLPGHGIRPVRGHAVNRWAYDGRALACRTYDEDGTDQSLLLLAFDPSVGDYAGFSVTSRSTFFAIERGRWLTDATVLELDGEETVAGRAAPIHYRRTFSFPTSDRFDIAIGYPDDPPGTYGPLILEHHRTDS